MVAAAVCVSSRRGEGARSGIRGEGDLCASRFSLTRRDHALLLLLQLTRAARRHKHRRHLRRRRRRDLSRVRHPPLPRADV